MNNEFGLTIITKPVTIKISIFSKVFEPKPVTIKISRISKVVEHCMIKTILKRHRNSHLTIKNRRNMDSTFTIYSHPIF